MIRRSRVFRRKKNIKIKIVLQKKLLLMTFLSSMYPIICNTYQPQIRCACASRKSIKIPTVSRLTQIQVREPLLLTSKDWSKVQTRGVRLISVKLVLSSSEVLTACLSICNTSLWFVGHAALSYPDGHSRHAHSRHQRARLPPKTRIVISLLCRRRHRHREYF